MRNSVFPHASLNTNFDHAPPISRLYPKHTSKLPSFLNVFLLKLISGRNFLK
ncbi:hypothetical protein HanIR_Chr00c29g0911841 [Helianthus annuus]|nr:hypothetical protein HanIR_Chr00c29g0911841 [Helianthus annuus]